MRRLRQLVVGMVALPISTAPFLAYASLTAEGRLLRDKVRVALSPPTLPELSGAELAAARRAAPRYRDGVMALAYHGIGAGSDGEGGYVVSPGRFGEHLATLRAAGMHAVTAAEVARAFAGGKPLPPRAVLITFDDGRTDAMLYADPLLEQADMKATMFVITGAAADPGVYYASWKRLESAARSGRWDLQSHTHQSHRDQKVAGGRRLPVLTSLAPGESLAEYRARVRDDLGKASRALEAHTGHAPAAFAYPFGAYGADRTNHGRIRAVLAEEIRRRYAVAFQQDDQDTIPVLTPRQPRATLRRLEVEDWSGLELLQRIRAAARRAGADGRPSGNAEPTEVTAPAPTPAPEAATTVPAPPAPTAPSASVVPPRRGSTAASTGGVIIPPSTRPPTTCPPTTSPPTTRPPTTRPPTTRPPTTRPPTTSPPTTSPPATSPPTNCGGKPHGQPCKK